MASGWWNPGNGYGQTQDWYNTDLVRLNPDTQTPNWGEYERFITNAGFGGNDASSGWARNQYNRANTGYQAAFMDNPEMDFRTYLQNLGPGWLENQVQGLTPNQLGYSAPGQTRIIRR